MANYLVTGGAGFIGSNIVEELVRRKGQKRGLSPKGTVPFSGVGKIRVLDSFITGNMENLKPFLSSIELIKGDIRKTGIEAAIDKCRKANTPFADVASAGLSFYGHGEKEISNNMERTLVIETNLLEKHTTIVGTIGSTSVYIGLFGTVLGIIKAFNDISSSGAGGINVVTTGISESLVCTAAGLVVAVPAVMAYNYFMKKIDNFITDMELCASETMDLLTLKQK